LIITSSLSEQVEQAVKHEIVSGALAPGQRLSLDELAERMGVSIMPVRDAVRRLESAGFLIVSSRRGVFVSRFDFERFQHLFDIRMALECLAVELSVHRILEDEIDKGLALYCEGQKQLTETGESPILSAADNTVHQLILRYCHNPELIAIMNGLQELIDWGHRIMAMYQPAALEHAAPEHIAILEALKARDAGLAVSAMRAHLQGTLTRTLGGWPEIE
jgi:DNA-binding GntR family transcriptional regulator